MTLRITDITFRNFRSYEELRLGKLGMLTVLVGPNAVGKTNIVEGVQLLTALSSFRHATIDQLVRHGEAAAHLSASLTDGNRLLDVELAAEGHAKRYRLNGKAKRPADLKGLVPSVTFTPDDLGLVKGSMSVRRAALDALGSQINANYYLIQKDYEKVIRHKNRLLKEETSPTLIDSINEMLVTCGAQLTCYRAALFERLIPHMRARYEQIAGERERFDACYVPSWDEWGDGSGVPACAVKELASHHLTRDEARACLERALAVRRDEELRRRRALVGPHADAITFMIDGSNATHFGSQGQQRTVVLAYKLAEAAAIEEVLGVKPVLLLDDVMSELDGARREALVGYISRDVQTFVTTANLAYFDAGMLATADVVELPLAPSRKGVARAQGEEEQPKGNVSRETFGLPARQADALEIGSLREDLQDASASARQTDMGKMPLSPSCEGRAQEPSNVSRETLGLPARQADVVEFSHTSGALAQERSVTS
ncbi:MULTISPECIES: DNA replication/repair protein RecF [unclassified Adlercreutzia]|uniref:DNA replication/repair protein RecF n=1 Tax=unclassified Adlercreutzia TaxID=2636013 RepID=UPI0013EB5EE7|nr:MULTISPECIES: DNA replication and repair protein RecF [unclassified Adlercreutzia]